jgi:hypothetical protein
VRRAVIILLVCAAVGLFFIANRGAYKGYFSADDVDNIAWTGASQWSTFAWGLVAPRYYPQHFRPVGHGTYALLSKWAAFRYPPYVLVVHVLHLLNTLLVYLLLRRLQAPPWTAAAGALLFLFPMQVFDALWKPMYLFDVWCGFFTLLCVLLWMEGRYVLAFGAFWLAFKSKEHAVMLPVVLAAYEYWLGEKRWKPLAPFFALSAALGLQGFWLNKQQGDDYRIQVSVWGVAKTVSFYLSRVMLLPWLGVALLFLPKLTRDRRVYFALAAGGVLLVPVLLLPGRMFAAYLYVSLAFVLGAVALALGRYRWQATAVFLLVWLPLNYAYLRKQRRGQLTYAQENYAYLERIMALPRELPDVRRFIIDGHPAQMEWWGIQGGLRRAYGTFDLTLMPVDTKNIRETLAGEAVALLTWDEHQRKLMVTAHRPKEPDASYITLTRSTQFWQLGEGWYQAEHNFRWTAPRATAYLWRPAEAGRFRVVVNVGPQYIEMVKRVRLRVYVDDSLVGETEFTTNGWKTVDFPLKPAGARNVTVRFEVDPPLKPNPNELRLLGIPLGGFGFVP